jgi:hypothetical protein
MRPECHLLFVLIVKILIRGRWPFATEIHELKKSCLLPILWNFFKVKGAKICTSKIEHYSIFTVNFLWALACNFIQKNQFKNSEFLNWPHKSGMELQLPFHWHVLCIRRFLKYIFVSAELLRGSGEYFIKLSKYQNNCMASGCAIRV